MKKKWLFLVAGIILVVGGLLVAFLWPKKSDKELYIDAVKKSLRFDVFGEQSETSKESNEEYFKNHILNAVATIEEISNGETKSVKVDGYFTEGRTYLSLIETLMGNTSSDVTYYVTNNKMYIQMKELLDYVYYYDLDQAESKITAVDTKDVDGLLKIVKKAIEDSIDNGRVEIKSSERSINGEKLDTKRFSYEFTGKDISTIGQNIIKGIKEDKDLYKKLDNALRANGVDIEEAFEKVNEYLKEAEKLDKLFSYAVYMMGDKVVSQEVSFYVTANEITVPISFTINRTETFFQVNVGAMGIQAFDLTIDKKAGKISLKVQSQELVSGTIKDGVIELTGNNMDIVIKYDKKAKTAYAEIVAKDEEGNETKTIIELKVNEVKEIPKFDTTNSKPVSEATDKDKQILDAIFNVPKVQDIIGFGEELQSM